MYVCMYLFILRKKNEYIHFPLKFSVFIVIAISSD